MRNVHKPAETRRAFAGRPQIGHPVASMTVMLRRLCGLAAACVFVGGSFVLAVAAGGNRSPKSHPTLRPALLALTGDADRTATGPPARRARLTSDYPRNAPTFATASATAASATFGQPTMAGIGGWGFEPDLRLDPSNANRLYMSSPDSANSDASLIWRSLDGGRTLKSVPAQPPL